MQWVDGLQMDRWIENLEAKVRSLEGWAVAAV